MIGVIIDLKNIAENNKAEMSVNVYNLLWKLIEKLEKSEKERAEGWIIQKKVEDGEMDYQ